MAQGRRRVRRNTRAQARRIRDIRRGRVSTRPGRGSAVGLGFITGGAGVLGTKAGSRARRRLRKGLKGLKTRRPRVKRAIR